MLAASVAARRLVRKFHSLAHRCLFRCLLALARHRKRARDDRALTAMNERGLRDIGLLRVGAAIRTERRCDAPRHVKPSCLRSAAAGSRPMSASFGGGAAETRCVDLLADL